LFSDVATGAGYCDGVRDLRDLGSGWSNTMSWLLSIVIVLFLFFVLQWLYQTVSEDSELGNASRRRKMRDLGRRSIS
jgi:hypothetical protein